jgi:hypothetical protein
VEHKKGRRIEHALRLRWRGRKGAAPAARSASSWPE